MPKRKGGWNEWAQTRASLYLGCTHACRYCFARADALHFGRIKSPDEWTRPVLREKELARKWSKRQGVVAFPGTHDITPANLAQCERYLASILKAGNRVLIVTKPHLECVERLCRSLGSWREQVTWRFTIGAESNGLLEYWEPNAPLFGERMNALQHAATVGYSTSVSMEPCLDTFNAPWLVHELAPWIYRGKIWIGKLNKIRQRVRIETDEDRRQVEAIEAGQTDEKVMALVKALNGYPLICWKDSIQEIIERAKP